jgi:hypothetical protein
MLTARQKNKNEFSKMIDFNEIIMGSLTPLETKGEIFVYGIEERMKASLEYIKTKYKKSDLLNRSIEFISYHHSEAVKADFKQLYTVGYFPATETEMELDHSIKHALVGSYKSAFADLRRALELSLISVYLTSETYDTKKALDWVMSRSDTPGFSKSLDKLIKEGRYKEFNDEYSWKKNLQEFYWQLSDFSHNKGQLKGYRELNKTRSFIGSTSLPSINVETLATFCDFYIKTVGEIVVVLSLYNPMILVGAPLDEKFGLNGPASGFFYDHQAELVHLLIPESYKKFFKELAENDIEINSLLDYLNSLPNLTTKDVEEQVKAWNELLEDTK